MYHQDYYNDKTIEIISNIIARKEEEVSEHLIAINYKVDPKYPYRYLSSYAIDHRLEQNGNSYKFLRYDSNHRYEGNFEYRRRDFNN